MQSLDTLQNVAARMCAAAPAGFTHASAAARAALLQQVVSTGGGGGGGVYGGDDFESESKFVAEISPSSREATDAVAKAAQRAVTSLERRRAEQMLTFYGIRIVQRGFIVGIWDIYVVHFIFDLLDLFAFSLPHTILTFFITPCLFVYFYFTQDVKGKGRMQTYFIVDADDEDYDASFGNNDSDDDDDKSDAKLYTTGVGNRFKRNGNSNGGDDSPTRLYTSKVVDDDDDEDGGDDDNDDDNDDVTFDGVTSHGVGKRKVNFDFSNISNTARKNTGGSTKSTKSVGGGGGGGGVKTAHWEAAFDISTRRFDRVYTEWLRRNYGDDAVAPTMMDISAMANSESGDAVMFSQGGGGSGDNSGESSHSTSSWQSYNTSKAVSVGSAFSFNCVFSRISCGHVCTY
jgi:hypothetical protein